MSNKIIPRLVDEKLIESIVQSTNKPSGFGLQKPNLSSLNIQTNGLRLFIEKYWIIILIVILIGGFAYYHYYYKSEKKEIKEDFKDKKPKKSKKKVRIQEHYDPSCPSCGNKDANCPTCNKFNGKMSEIEKPIEHLEYEQQIKYPTQSHEHYEEPQYEPRHATEQHIEQMYNQPQQQSYETTYHNQFYGQSITDDAQGMNRNDIETFNSGTVGNYVAF
jgi:hypothetical protein